MSRRTRTAAALLASALLAVGCGSLRDEVAATVGGEDIPVAEVSRLAGSPIGELVAQGATGSADLQRAALGILVQDRLYAFEIRRRGGELTDDDRAQGRSQADQVEQQGTELSAEDRALVERLVTNQTALFRLGLSDPAAIDDDAVAAYFAAHRDEFPERLICLEGLVAPVDAVDELVASIEDGTSFDDVITSRSDGVFPIEQTGSSTCVAPGTITTPGLATIVEEGPLGAVQRFETVGQDGSPVALVLRVASRDATTGTEPLVVEQVRQALEQEAQASQQEELRGLLGEVVRRAEVHVDPRYGRFDPTSSSFILPPPVPRPATPRTAAPAALGG